MTLVSTSSVLALTDVWTGEREHTQVLASGELRVVGPASDAKRLWHWLGLSAFPGTRAERRTALSCVGSWLSRQA